MVFLWGGGGGGEGCPDMTFFNFLCQNVESVSLSEIVLESFDFQMVTTLTIFDKKTCTKEPPRDTITLEGAQTDITTDAHTKVDQSFQACIPTCVK